MVSSILEIMWERESFIQHKKNVESIFSEMNEKLKKLQNEMQVESESESYSDCEPPKKKMRLE